MKIDILSAGRQWGGLEVHAAALARTLESRGHTVTIVQLGCDSFSRRREARRISTRLVHLPLGRPGVDTLPQDVGLLEWRRALRRLDGDVCVFTKGDFDVASYRLDVAARLQFRRYITIEQLAHPMPARSSRRHAGGLIPGVALWWHRTRLRRRLRSPWPHAVVCVSDAVRRPLAHDYGFPDHKLRTIHNGIDVDGFRRDADVRRRARAAWGVPDDALVFGSVGRLHPRKAVDAAVESFARLRRSRPDRDMRLVLVGEGPARPELETLVHGRGIADAVVFAGYTDNPQSAYSGIDVFVLSSLNEGLPLALVEAMACECCPVSTAVGGVPEVIVRPQLGWMVPPGNPKALFRAMEAAAQLSPAELASMGRSARAHAISHFDSRILLGHIADLVEAAS